MNRRAFLLLVVLTAALLLKNRRKDDPYFIVGHRGAAGLAPENTMASLKLAHQLGAGWLEVDIQRTRDRVLVVMHDATADRTTNGSGSIGEMDWEQVAQLDASKGMEKYAGEPVPRLSDVLTFIVENDLMLCIEVKDPQIYPGIAEELAAELREYNAQSRVVIISFDLAWLRGFSEIAPDIAVGALWKRIESVDAVPSAKYIDVHWSSALLDLPLIWQAKQSGRTILVWTCNSPLIAYVLKWVGVNGVTTDRPDLLVPTAQ